MRDATERDVAQIDQMLRVLVNRKLDMPPGQVHLVLRLRIDQLLDERNRQRAPLLTAADVPPGSRFLGFL